MTGSSSADSALRQAVVTEARRWIRTPYRHQASLCGVGCDCLGLLRGVWRAVIGPEPEPTGAYTVDWAEVDGSERLAAAALRHLTPTDIAAFEAGDVLLFRWRSHLPAKHVAIATSYESMVHAHDGAAVCETAIAPWWRRRIAYAFSFPPAVALSSPPPRA